MDRTPLSADMHTRCCTAAVSIWTVSHLTLSYASLRGVDALGAALTQAKAARCSECLEITVAKCQKAKSVKCTRNPAVFVHVSRFGDADSQFGLRGSCCIQTFMDHEQELRPGAPGAAIQLYGMQSGRDADSRLRAWRRLPSDVQLNVVTCTLNRDEGHALVPRWRFTTRGASTSYNGSQLSSVTACSVSLGFFCDHTRRQLTHRAKAAWFSECHPGRASVSCDGALFGKTAKLNAMLRIAVDTPAQKIEQGCECCAEV